MSLPDDLAAIQTAYDDGDFATARTLSDGYVAANPTVYTDDIQAMSIEACVNAVDVFRAGGDGFATNLWQMEAWLFHHFMPQNIGGPVQAVVRAN